jgi:hypothetical protein
MQTCKTDLGQASASIKIFMAISAGRAGPPHDAK